MIQNGNGYHTAERLVINDRELSDSLAEIKGYLQTNIRELTVQSERKDAEIKNLQDALEKASQQSDGNSQLINKLLGDLNKLKNDIEWYKLTYEKRSLLGVLKDKIKFYFR